MEAECGGNMDAMIPELDWHQLDWHLVAYGLVVLLLLLLITRFLSRRRRPLAQISRIVRKFSVEIRGPVIVPGIDGQQYSVDYVVMTPCAIWVLDVLDYEGMIFGGSQTDEWTQVIGRKSFRFTNPLYVMRDKRIQVQTMTDLEEIKSAVVFSRASNFPKDRPGGIVQQENLAQLLACPGQERKKQQNAHLQRAWDQIVTELSIG